MGKDASKEAGRDAGKDAGNESQVIQYVRGLGRLEMSRQEIADDLHLLGKHGCAWTRASVGEWLRLIDQELASGSLRVTQHGFIKLPLPAETLVQGSLF